MNTRPGSPPDSLIPAAPQFAARMGFTIFRPMKSLSLSVTRTQSFASATAAMIMSRGLRGCPAAVPAAITRSDKASLLIEGEHAAREQRLRTLGA